MNCLLTPQRAAAVYDVLVKFGGARENDRESFVYHMVHGCSEWRFGGLLGFGGKFSPCRFTVDCYPEDETPKLLRLIKRINKYLHILKATME